jgi:hypothetical protein
VFAFALLAFQVVIDGIVWQHPRTLWPSPQGNLALQMLDGIGRVYETALPAAQTGMPFAVAIAIGAFAVTLSAVLIALSAAEARPGEGPQDVSKAHTSGDHDAGAEA